MQSSSNKGWRRCTFGFLTTQAQPHLLQLSSMRGLPCARPCVAALPRACLPCCCTHVLIRPLQAQHVCFSTQHHPPPHHHTHTPAAAFFDEWSALCPALWRSPAPCLSPLLLPSPSAPSIMCSFATSLALGCASWMSQYCFHRTLATCGAVHTCRTHGMNHAVQTVHNMCSFTTNLDLGCASWMSQYCFHGTLATCGAVHTGSTQMQYRHYKQCTCILS